MRTNISIVRCDTHGTMNQGNNTREVKVTTPDNKRQKLSGCPQCRRDKKAANK